MMMGSKAKLCRVLCLPVVLGIMALSALSITAAMSMTPYLQAVTTDSVYVLVECGSTDPVTVEYGSSTSYGSKAVTENTESTDASPATYVHNVKLAGLKPNSVYHYRTSQGGPPTADYTFITAAVPGTGFRFGWMADCRSGTGPHDEIALRLKGANPRFLLYGGDMCVDPSYKMFKAEFFRPNELALIAQVPFFLAPGNHETWGKNTKAFTQAPASPSGTQDYYSFNYGDVHFLCINNEIPYNAGTPQYDFVAKDLAGAKQPWKIVFAHVPAYCSGGHGEDPTMVEMTTKIFEPNGVDLVLVGHSHFYQHNLVNGLHHLVIGTAGADFKDPVNSSYTLKSVRDYNYAIVDMTPATLHLVVYNASGAVLDTLDLAKTGGKTTPVVPATVPAAPSGLAAKAETGKVTVSWQPSAWAASYSVKRGTADKGPFAVIKSGLIANQYSDTAVTNGTTYYYVVSAVNAKGESPDSAPIAATPREATKTATVTGTGAVKLLPKDDSYVNGGSKETLNFGSEDKIQIKHSDVDDVKYERVAFLKFDLSGIKGKIKSATLKLYCDSLPNGTPVPLTIFAVDDDSWSETAVTYLTAPKAGTKLQRAVLETPATTYSFDLTAYIAEQLAKDKIASLRLEDVDKANKMIYIRSKENAAADTVPYLEIVFE